MKEIWKDIESYEGLYKVSNLGRIMSLIDSNQYASYKRKKILKPGTTDRGYHQVILTKDGIKKNKSVHRIVAKHFCDGFCIGYVVNHIDGNKINNIFHNLEWCSQSENIKHSFSNLGRKPTKYWKGKSGVNHHSSKKILQYTIDGEFLQEWDCAVDAGKHYGKSHYHIYSCCSGKRKQALGFTWKYKE